MCGIVGYFSKGAWKPDDRVFEESIQTLIHRGPDQMGIWKDDRVGLGFRRLSIIDLQSGNQPMSNEKGNLCLVFNGEIYNFKILRKELEEKGRRFRTQSDSEVILHLYEEMGENCVERLRGMFALAIYNSQEGTLFLARDRFGKKPLIYGEDQNAFFFASEIKPLLQLGNISRKVNWEAIQAYLAFRYVPGSMTAWKNLARLPPASRMWIKKGVAQPPERYWHLPSKKLENLSEAESLHSLREIFEESVRLRMISDVPLGVFLSGGIDSCVTAAAMTRCGARLKTFSIGFENPKFDESTHAREAARILGSEHHELRVQADSLENLDSLLDISGEPFADQSLLPTHLLSKFTRGHVTVALSGDGGDELFGGYKRYDHLARADHISKWGLQGFRLASSYSLFKVEQLFNPRRRSLQWPRSALDRILPLSPLDRYTHLVSSWPHGHRLRFLTHRKNLFSTTQYLQAFFDRNSSQGAFSVWQKLDLNTYLPDDILRKVDWASMACSLECRCPFLDHDLVDFIARLPLNSASNTHPPKRLLRKMYPDLFPPAFFQREKKGFSMPIGDWMRNQWKEILRGSVFRENPSFQPFFNTSLLRQIWDEHQLGTEDHGDRLWTWHVLNRWDEKFKPVWEA